LPIADLTRDPVLVAFFRRTERDNGNAFAIPAPRKPVLTGGEAKRREVAHV
jgi:hypothetical protein